MGLWKPYLLSSLALTIYQLVGGDKAEGGSLCPHWRDLNLWPDGNTAWWYLWVFFYSAVDGSECLLSDWDWHLFSWTWPKLTWTAVVVITSYFTSYFASWLFEHFSWHDLQFTRQLYLNGLEHTMLNDFRKYCNDISCHNITQLFHWPALISWPRSEGTVPNTNVTKGLCIESKIQSIATNDLPGPV